MNGEGENGGVVYCEMQGTENVGENKTHRGPDYLLTYPGLISFHLIGL